MLLALLGAIAFAPLYWLLTPPRWRREVLALASLAVLVAYDPRVAAVVLGVALGLFAALRAMRAPSTARDRVLVVGGLVALAALFVWNKRGARGGGVLPLYAFTLRFYFDFAGYSDIAIGLAALFGYDIEENFDNPLVRRNLVQLWQRWHMTLTGWLRRHLFIPTSRALLRCGWPDALAIGAAQLVTMVFCGLWHEIGWGFALWGASQAVGLVWVGIVARDLGRRLPHALVAWWRRSPVAYALSTALTFNAFALPLVFVVSSVGGGFRYLALLVRR